MKEKIALVFSFILIFSFSAMDNSISPMAKEISSHYYSDMDFVLKLISVSTFFTVIGVFMGPWLLSKIKPYIVLLSASFLILLSQLLFVFSNNIFSAFFSRIVAGFSTGAIAGVMWWMSYHWISKNYYHYMIAVLVSARPLATALGVPASGLMAFSYSWTVPFLFLSVAVFVFGFFVSWVLKNGEKIEEKGLLRGYEDVLKVPYVKPFYLGFMINKMCYFGFYAVCGIWFIEHYGLNLKEISLSLLIIGIFEVMVNFTAGRLIKRFGFRNVFDKSVFLSFVLLIIFIWGKINIDIAVFLIAIFMLLDRIYSMAAVIKIPEMFKYEGNKTVFGSLNTLSMWLGLSIISAVSSRIISSIGIVWVEVVLLLCFIVGSSLMLYVNLKTIYKTI